MKFGIQMVGTRTKQLIISCEYLSLNKTLSNICVLDIFSVQVWIQIRLKLCIEIRTSQWYTMDHPKVSEPPLYLNNVINLQWSKSYLIYSDHWTSYMKITSTLNLRPICEKHFKSRHSSSRVELLAYQYSRSEGEHLGKEN